MTLDSSACLVPKPFPSSDPKYLQFPTQLLNIGVSTSALFDTREDDEVFREKGELAYMRHMREKKDVPFAPGPVLPFIKKMLGFNDQGDFLVNLTLLSRNNPHVALRVHYSLYAHDLCNNKGAMRHGIGEAYMKGRPITPSLMRNFGVDLFLSPNLEDVENALREGIAAGQTFHSALPTIPSFSNPNTLIAFDFDRVLGLGLGKQKERFKGDSEAYFRAKGLEAYYARENSLAAHPAHPGPLAIFFMKIVQLREHLHKTGADKKLEIALVTARTGDALPRATTTLDFWGEMMTEADYLIGSGYTPKTGHLEELQADAFFDDSEKHVKGALNTTASILVPYVEPRAPTPKRGGKPKKLIH